MRSTLLLAPLAFAAAALAAPHKPVPDTISYQSWSYREMGYGYGTFGGNAVAEAKAAFEKGCKTTSNGKAIAHFASTKPKLAGAKVGCIVFDKDHKIAEDLTFKAAYDLLWSPFLWNRVAKNDDYHIYDHKNIEDPPTLWNQACTAGQGMPKFTTDEGTAGANQAVVYCSKEDLDITGSIARGLGWTRLERRDSAL